MAVLLSGLTVVFAGDSRSVRAAARWYADLGARVYLRSQAARDPLETAWLGDFDAPGDRICADLRVIEYGADETGLSAPVTLRFASSSSTAPQPRAMLTERQLAGASAVAIAIGEPDRPPLPAPEGILDHLVASHLAAAGLAALLRGDRDVEIAATDVLAWSVAANMNLYLPYGAEWKRAGRRASGSGGCYPYSLFKVADGQYCLIGRTRRDWDNLVRAMGAPDWTQQTEFQNLRAMAQDYPEQVDERLAPWLTSHTRAQMNALAAEYGFPGGPALRPQEVLRLPSLEGRWCDTQAGPAPVKSLLAPCDVNEIPGAEPVDLLASLRVLDLSWVWSGPAVGVALADLGATVIKVESSTRPDNSRLRGAPRRVHISVKAPRLELTPYFQAVNRGKHSIALNLATAEGREQLLALAAQADVIVENFSAGVMDRLGIGPEVVHSLNPGCVYLSLRGYRKHPTTAGLRAYAPVLTGAAGVEALVRYPGEQAIGMMTYGFSDANAASQGLLHVLAALWARRARGVGAALMLPQAEGAMLANGLNLTRAQFGLDEDGLRPLDTEPVIGTDTLPTAPWTSPDLFTTIASPWIGDVLASKLPWRLDGAFPEARRPGPELGADTDRILGDDLGLSASRIAKLREAGALT